jgi:hypothetical protein
LFRNQPKEIAMKGHTLAVATAALAAATVIFITTAQAIAADQSRLCA